MREMMREMTRETMRETTRDRHSRTEVRIMSERIPHRFPHRFPRRFPHRFPHRFPRHFPRHVTSRSEQSPDRLGNVRGDGHSRIRLPAQELLDRAGFEHQAPGALDAGGGAQLTGVAPGHGGFVVRFLLRPRWFYSAGSTVHRKYKVYSAAGLQKKKSNRRSTVRGRAWAELLIKSARVRTEVGGKWPTQRWRASCWAQRDPCPPGTRPCITWISVWRIPTMSCQASTFTPNTWSSTRIHFRPSTTSMCIRGVMIGSASTCMR
jgi:hypothetical protein